MHALLRARLRERLQEKLQETGADLNQPRLLQGKTPPKQPRETQRRLKTGKPGDNEPQPASGKTGLKQGLQIRLTKDSQNGSARIAKKLKMLSTIFLTVGLALPKKRSTLPLVVAP